MSFQLALVMNSLHYSSCCGPVCWGCDQWLCFCMAWPKSWLYLVVYIFWCTHCSCYFSWETFSCSWPSHLTTLIHCHAAGSAWTLCNALLDQRWHVVFTCAIHFRVFCPAFAFGHSFEFSWHAPTNPSCDTLTYVLHHIWVWSTLSAFPRIVLCWTCLALSLLSFPRPGIFLRVVIN